MSNLRERPRNGTSSLEDDVILLAIRQAFVEWGSSSRSAGWSPWISA